MSETDAQKAAIERYALVLVRLGATTDHKMRRDRRHGEWVRYEAAQAEIERLTREAFHAAFQAGLMAVDKFGEQHTSADEAWAEFQARPSSGTGSGDKEQL